MSNIADAPRINTVECPRKICRCINMEVMPKLPSINVLEERLDNIEKTPNPDTEKVITGVGEILMDLTVRSHSELEKIRLKLLSFIADIDNTHWVPINWCGKLVMCWDSLLYAPTINNEYTCKICGTVIHEKDDIRNHMSEFLCKVTWINPKNNWTFFENNN